MKIDGMPLGAYLKDRTRIFFKPLVWLRSTLSGILRGNQMKCFVLYEHTRFCGINTSIIRGVVKAENADMAANSLFCEVLESDEKERSYVINRLFTPMMTKWVLEETQIITSVPECMINKRRLKRGLMGSYHPDQKTE